MDPSPTDHPFTIGQEYITIHFSFHICFQFEPTKEKDNMALRMWASSTANALRISCGAKPSLSPAFSLSRCFSSGALSLSLSQRQSVRVNYSWNLCLTLFSINGFPLVLNFFIFFFLLVFFKFRDQQYKVRRVFWNCEMNSSYLINILELSYICSSGWIEICLLTWMGEAWRLNGYNWYHWSCSGYCFHIPSNWNLWLCLYFHSTFKMTLRPIPIKCFILSFCDFSFLIHWWEYPFPCMWLWLFYIGEMVWWNLDHWVVLSSDQLVHLVQRSSLMA